jgi:predicted kinase
MLLCGPPGSGKSTFAVKYAERGFIYINQDSQGKDHMRLFNTAIMGGSDVIVDRMNFSKIQRSKYLDIAKNNGYETAITVFHEPYSACLNRCIERKEHETIKDETNARSALNLFFSKYERVSDDEADTVQRMWPDGLKTDAIICDLDGTLCNVDHRTIFVDGLHKNWKGFFEAIPGDTPNKWCVDILQKFIGPTMAIVYCSGRPDTYQKITEDWLKKYNLYIGPTYMRNRSDNRPDNITKEIILDFEILTRYTPYFMLDDRQTVVNMWRKRGYTCLQCAPGDF